MEQAWEKHKIEPKNESDRKARKMHVRFLTNLVHKLADTICERNGHKRRIFTHISIYDRKMI